MNTFKPTKQLNHCPIAWQALNTPHAIAIESDTQSLCYAALNQRINSLSEQLIQLNMRKGDRLVCIASNGLPLVLLQLTCVRNGFIFCPLNPKFSDAERLQRLTLLDSNFIWQEGNPSSLPLEFESIIAEPPVSSPVTIDPLAVVSIIFTSGSSGSPKAVMHHFSNHYYSALGSQTVIPLVGGDKNLLSLPMFHISGYATVMRTMLAGATLRLLTGKITIEQLKRNMITHLSLVSSQLQQLLDKSDFQPSELSIKHLLLGGSAFLSEQLQQTRQRGFNYHLSYGSTEMASQIATSTNNEKLQLLPYRQLKIANKEIMLNGETRFVGYFKGKAGIEWLNRQDYFASADLGKINEQALTVIGRKDRQFISGGENIQPEEIEKHLVQFSAVIQAVVVPIPDATYGHRPVAFIKWQKTQQPTQLSAFIKDKLIAFKRPLHYFDLPEQAGLKPNSKQLTEIALKLLFIN